MLDSTRSRFLFAALLLSSACSDDGNKDLPLEDGGGAATAADGGGSSPSGDQGRDLDAAVSLDATVVFPDGENSLLDGALADGGLLVDGAVLGDASAPDASEGPCEVRDPRYGCGTLSGKDWVSFPDFEVDLANKVAWTKPMTVVDDDALAAICPVLTTGGFAWELPQMEDIRKLAAGCPKTMPGGSCQVDIDEVLTTEAGDCSCGDVAGTGPNQGKFCRPEVPNCE
ncbi:MAG TPA: hypothetical protein VI299_13190, partial [Polyangiales bacterium]